MKIYEVIDQLDALKANAYKREQKIRWLSVLDGRIHGEVFCAHEGEVPAFAGYNELTPVDTELLVPHPYDEVYLRWLEAQIDYHNGEYKKYNNSMAMFEAAFDAFRNHYRKNHKPKGAGCRFLF